MPVLPRARLGLVGAGRWGRNYIKTIKSIPNAVLTAVSSRNPSTPALLPPGCRVEIDWRDIVHADDIDGVIVASPPGTHAEILIESIKAGKPVLVEKPVAITRPEVIRIRRHLADHRSIISVDHTHLYDQAFRALRRKAASLGPVRLIQSSAGS